MQSCTAQLRAGCDDSMTPAPPTIAHLKTHGLKGLFVTCSNAACLHSAPFTFAALDLEDEVQFPAIARSRRFVCSRCGARTVNVMPDWRKLNARGMGR
jgi:hypothetical protein